MYIYYNEKGIIKMKSDTRQNAPKLREAVVEDVSPKLEEVAKYNGQVFYEESEEALRRKKLLVQLGKAKSIDELKEIIKELI